MLIYKLYKVYKIYSVRKKQGSDLNAVPFRLVCKKLARNYEFGARSLKLKDRNACAHKTRLPSNVHHARCT